MYIYIYKYIYIYVDVYIYIIYTYLSIYIHRLLGALVFLFEFSPAGTRPPWRAWCRAWIEAWFPAPCEAKKNTPGREPFTCPAPGGKSNKNTPGPRASQAAIRSYGNSKRVWRHCVSPDFQDSEIPKPQKGWRSQGEPCEGGD